MSIDISIRQGKIEAEEWEKEVKGLVRIKTIRRERTRVSMPHIVLSLVRCRCIVQIIQCKRKKEMVKIASHFKFCGEIVK